jgi:two-component system sensor histidine kinase/response regulator
LEIGAYLLKPVQQSELLEAIRQVVSRATPDAAPAKATPPAPEPDRAAPAPVTPLHILVAEDNEFNVILLKQLFGQRGHVAQITSNGREAVAQAARGEFDVLLLDIHMPEMDGFGVARAIREQERSSGKRLPIIAFTARTGKADRQRCLDAGMDDFLSKPVQAEALWEVIDRVVAAHAQETTENSNLLSPRTILAACGGNPNLLQKICHAFQTTVPDQMSRVSAALREKDAPRLRETAHALSSTLAAFSAVAGSAASMLEDEAALGRVEECTLLVARLESMCSELLGQTSELSIEKLRAT